MMIFRFAIVGVVVLASAVPACAFGQKGWSFKGNCSSSAISRSDGIQTGVRSGAVDTKEYLALMKRARDSNLALGTDGFLWATQALRCDSAIVMQMDDHKGRTAVSFSSGDQANPVLIFAGDLIGGDGPLFFPDTIYLAGGKAMPIGTDGKGNACHFYFSDHGGFTQGWEHRLTAIACELKAKSEDGHLISSRATFNITQSSQ